MALMPPILDVPSPKTNIDSSMMLAISIPSKRDAISKEEEEVVEEMEAAGATAVQVSHRFSQKMKL
eukprot:scaffold14713_cov98-Cylindrotheca_fusiformis.AAC.1